MRYNDNKSQASVLHVTNLNKINCGASVSLIETVNSLKDHFPQVVFVTMEGELAETLRNKAGVKVYTSLRGPLSPDQRLFKGEARLREIIGFIKTLRRINPTIIHLNSAEKFFPLGWLSILSGKYTVAHQRETFTNGVSKIAMFFLDRIITISEYVKKSLPGYLQKNATTIYNPVTIKRANYKAIGKKYNDSTKSVKILYLGRFNLEKGPDLLLSSFLKIAHGTDSILNLVGYNESSNESKCIQIINNLLDQTTSSIRERVNIIPWTNNISKLLIESDILVMPSRVKEGLGRSALEAMAYGVPVVAANRGGLKEIVEEGVTGLLFNPQKENELAEKLNLLINNKELLTKMGLNSRQRVEEKFSLNNFQKSLLKLYSI